MTEARDVADHRWSVEERAWKQELPHLPDEVIALLATPVVVTASAFGAATDPVVADDDEEERYPSPLEPCGTLGDASVDRSPRFLAPAPPLRKNRRPRHPARIG
jgi:hypothetical protein